MSGLSTIALKGACGLVFATGAVALAATTDALAGPWLMLFDAVSWPMDGVPGALSPEAKLLSAISGAMMIGWGVLLSALVWGPVARGEREGRRLLWLSLSVWFVMDNVGSVLAGWPGNVALNTLFYAAFAVPLLASSRSVR